MAAWKWCQEKWLVTCAPKWFLQKDMGHDERKAGLSPAAGVEKSIQVELDVATQHWRGQD